MSEQNKAIVRRLFNEVGSKGNMEVISELITEDYVSHQLGAEDHKGYEGLEQLITMYRTAFPDMLITVDDQVAEGDRVATRWAATGTHQGELAGIPPTGKQVKVSAMSITRFEGGKIAEEWELADQMGLMQQLGVVPTRE